MIGFTVKGLSFWVLKFSVDDIGFQDLGFVV